MVHGFLLGMELGDGEVEIEPLLEKIADVLVATIPGIGRLDIEHLGALEYEGDDTSHGGMVELNVGDGGRIIES